MRPIQNLVRDNWTQDDWDWDDIEVQIKAAGVEEVDWTRLHRIKQRVVLYIVPGQEPIRITLK